MKTAKLLKTNPQPGGPADQKLWLLSEPLEGHTHVVTSAVTVLGEPETYIFASNEEGLIEEWGELDGSFRGELDHEQALRNAGYMVEQ